MATRRFNLGLALDAIIAPFSPARALSRTVARAQREVLVSRMGHYEAAGGGRRTSDFRKNRSDAIEANRAARAPLAMITRDMLRNNPRARRIRQQMVNQVVGAGILPSVQWPADVDLAAQKAVTDQIAELMRRHCLTTQIDTEGKLNLYAIQALTFGTIVSDGEVLLRRRFRRPSDGFALPFQVQVLEADYLDTLVDGELPNGNYAVQGVEFDQIGRPVWYHLYAEHPGGRRGLAMQSRRVAAENIIHAFRVDRPGMARGVSWLAPIVTKLHELDKYQDGQLKRQEIASLFAGVLSGDAEGEEFENEIGTLEAGTILTIGEDEKMEFTDPPRVEGYEDFMRVTERAIAAGVNLTYEGLSGDYSNVNYTSGRMGRMDVDPGVRDAQDNLMVPQVCNRLGAWIGEAIEDVTDISAASYAISWTPPVRPVVDPTKDHAADEVAMRSGKKSRRQVIRETGRDPNEVEAEIRSERQWETQNGVTFTSNAGAVARPGASPSEVGTEDMQDD